MAPGDCFIMLSLENLRQTQSETPLAAVHTFAENRFSLKPGQGGQPRVESRTGAVTVVSRRLLGWAFASPASIRLGLALFSVPAHRTGQADFPHPGSRKRRTPHKRSM